MSTVLITAVRESPFLETKAIVARDWSYPEIGPDDWGKADGAILIVPVGMKADVEALLAECGNVWTW